MKKSKLKKLTLRKASVSNFQLHAVAGGGITTFRFICTNHPNQDTDFCHSADFGNTCGCITNNNENTCQCTIA